MAKDVPQHHSPTMPPQQGWRSSKAITDFGIKVGHLLVHRTPTEMLLSQLPSPIKGLVMKSARIVGSVVLKPETELQTAMNGKMFMNTVDHETGAPLFEAVPDNYLKSLFPQGKPDQWPRQVAICTKDVRPDPAALRKTMLDLEDIVSEVIDQPIEVLGDFDQSAKGKTVVLGIYNTESNIITNADAVMERVQVLKSSPLSLDGISDAAKAAGQMILDTITLRTEGSTTVLRSDTADIFRHLMTHGFSQGGNIATDIFRYIRHELREGPYELALDESGHETLPIRTDQDIKPLLAGAHVFVIAAADPPYTKAELDVLPPRDHSRSDGDIVISAAVGVNKRQANYGARWAQDIPHLARGDRLLESIGPKKRAGGIFEKPGGYHSNLGHGDEQYRYSVVESHKAELAERWLPRFQPTIMADDITFSDSTISLHFSPAADPTLQAAAMKTLTQHLRVHGGIEVEMDVFPPNPYHLQLHATPTPDVLHHIQNGLAAIDAKNVAEVSGALDVETITQWLQYKLTGAPPMDVDVAITESGPKVSLTPSIGVGPHLQNLLDDTLKEAGFDAKQYRQKGGGIEIPIHDVLAAMKTERTPERKESFGR